MDESHDKNTQELTKSSQDSYFLHVNFSFSSFYRSLTHNLYKLRIIETDSPSSPLGLRKWLNLIKKNKPLGCLGVSVC